MPHADSQSSAPVTSSDHHIILQDDNIEDHDIPDGTVVEVPPDFPPESFWLSKDAEFDWFDQNAFLERKESTRGNVGSMNLNNPNVNPNTSSQRYSVSLKPKKTPIIGLPKTQKTTYVDLKCRQCKPLNVRMFPKQLYSFGKAPVTEPGSPKVSCMGRVRSKGCRSRKKSYAVEPEKSASQRSHKPGLMSFVRSLFRCDGNRRGNKSKSERSGSTGSRRICVSVNPVNSEPGTPSEPVGLGGMARFASGRR